MVVDHNMAAVTNVSVKHIRPEFHDLKEWCEEKNHLYIGRGGVVVVSQKTPSGEIMKTRYPSKDSVWANPYKIGKDGTRDEVLIRYREYIQKKLNEGKVDLEELKGKILGCWRVDEKIDHVRPDNEHVCHGEILLSLLAKSA
jgi:hypothetical protein